MDLETLLASKDPEHWDTVRTLILSGQVHYDRIAQIQAEHRDFAAWMAQQRKAA
jgi:hypothetical protein